MGYKILKDEFVMGDYSIVPIRDQDKFKIMKWRNDQLNILRQSKPLTETQQIDYFENVVKPDFSLAQPNQILVSYFLKGELIGYGGIVHIKWIDKRGEVSFLLETDRNRNIKTFQEDYAIFLNLIKNVAFNVLGFHKLTTEAFDLRPYLVETLIANGFVMEGRLRQHYVIEGKYVDSLLHACFS